MSRSYRKPYYSDKAHWKKKMHSRAYRSRCKQITKVFQKEYTDPELYISRVYLSLMWDEYPMTPLKEAEEIELRYPLEPEYPHPNAITNPYDLCDFRSRATMFHMSQHIYTYVHRGIHIVKVMPYWKDNTEEYRKACRK